MSTIFSINEYPIPLIPLWLNSNTGFTYELFFEREQQQGVHVEYLMIFEDTAVFSALSVENILYRVYKNGVVYKIPFNYNQLTDNITIYRLVKIEDFHNGSSIDRHLFRVPEHYCKF